MFARVTLKFCTLAFTVFAASMSGADVLFNGHNPTESWRGWKTAEYPAAWVVRNGALTLSGPVDDGWHKRGGYLVSKAQFADFDMSFYFKTSMGANSGVMVRVAMNKEVDWPWQTGTEFQILDERSVEKPETFAFKTADMYGIVSAANARTKLPGRWNNGRITACGRRIEHFLNGVRVLTVDLDSTDFMERVGKSKFSAHTGFAKERTGHIVLQDHGRPVWFRKMTITKLHSC